MPELFSTNSGLHYAFAPSPTLTETLALFVTFWNAYARNFLLGYGKLRIRHAEDAVFADSTPSQRISGSTAWFGRCGSKAELPDFGERLGGKAVNSHWADQSQDRQDPGADWGKHETTGVGKTGNLWRKVKSWFGCTWPPGCRPSALS